MTVGKMKISCLVALLVGAASLVAAVPAAAKPKPQPKFSGAVPGVVSCSWSARVTFSPPLTRSSGGTSLSKVTAGKVSSCTPSDSAVTITKGTMTGSFATSPLSCVALTSTGASPTLTLKWTGDLNGTVGGTTYAGRARLTATEVRGPWVTGSFAGTSVVGVSVPANLSALCGATRGIKKLTVTGSITGSILPSWGTATEVPVPSPPGTFSSVSCTDASDCTAVGGDDSNGEPIYATESGGTWGTPTEIPTPNGGSFNAVSCSDATDCTAVGDAWNGQEFYATESGGTWGAVTEIPTPNGGGFNGVSCSDATDCTAVGGDYIATESGGTWGTPTEIPTPYGGSFNAVICSDATDCTAVGGPYNSNYGQPFYATESGGTWGAAIKIPTSGGGGFNAVSCSNTTDCTAVGDAEPDGYPIYATESGGSWGPATESLPPGGFGRFSGVSCTDASDCAAVGWDNNGLPFYATELRGTWGTPTEIPTPNGGGFNAVSCSDATDCTAVGGDYNPTTYGQPIYATEPS